MLTLTGGRALVGGVLQETSLTIGDGLIMAVGQPEASGRVIDARGCLVLPGLVDIHGDAFERQIMPRPGVAFPIEMALRDTDRQLAANGVTTALHGVTWSWEPGLRGPENAHALVAAVEALRGSLLVDTHVHLRHETFNLDGEATILRWLADGKIAALAFNDHMASTVRDREKPLKLAKLVERSGVSEAAFLALTERAYKKADAVRPSIERLAAGARAAGVPMLSHDDASPADRRWYRELGAMICEFPMTVETAALAASHGDPIVFGAPNVVRGGSHTGCPSAAEMVAQGLCTVLASDYFYPALPMAAFRLVRDGVLPLAKAWALVSDNPAQALGLKDRGRLEPGLRADIVIARAFPDHLAIVATIVAGRIVYLDDAAVLAA